jgi:hypothetical protein
MKRLLIAIFLLCASTAWAGGITATGVSMTGATTVTSAPTGNFCDGTTALFCEDMESVNACVDNAGQSNCRIAWTGSGAGNTINDQATSIAPTGNYSKSMDANEGLIIGTDYHSFTSGNKTTLYFLLKIGAITVTDGQSRYFHYSYSVTAGTTRCIVGINNTGGTLRFYTAASGGTAALASSLTPTANTLYHIWSTYENGTGANAHCHLVVATDGVYATGDTASSTNGTGTGGAERIYFLNYHAAGAGDHLNPVTIDNIKVRTSATAVTPFGDNGAD